MSEIKNQLIGEPYESQFPGDLVLLSDDDRQVLREVSEKLEESDPYLAGRLAGLSGRPGSIKILDEICAAESEMLAKRWYDRSVMMAGKNVGTPEIRQIAANGRKRVEEVYGKENLGPYSKFEWGVLYGKHIALRWVLEPEADWDDDWLGDT
jgi:hypothetical protein